MTRYVRLVAMGLLVAVVPVGVGCKSGPATPKHRERSESHDTGCTQPGKPAAYFYPAENRTDYKPDNPLRDGCTLLVADHLFCCPNEPRETDR